MISLWNLCFEDQNLPNSVLNIRLHVDTYCFLGEILGSGMICVVRVSLAFPMFYEEVVVCICLWRSIVRKV